MLAWLHRALIFIKHFKTVIITLTGFIMSRNDYGNFNLKINRSFKLAFFALFKVNYSLIFELKNEVTANLNTDKRISKCQPVWKKRYYVLTR